MPLFNSLKRLFQFKKVSPPGTRGPSSTKVIFNRFRDVLKCNNAALEIIADMGEKLGGNYIFDRHYVETSTKALSHAVLRSVHALNLLCDNRFQVLYQVYDQITERLESILEGREDRQGPLTIPFHEITRQEWPVVGGKVAHMARIISDLKMDVPEGFVIATRAYHDLVDFNGLRGKIDRFEALMAKADGNNEKEDEELEDLRREIEDAILHSRPPPGLVARIEKEISDLVARCPSPLSMAVRSSAQEEDQDFSFAGQFRSVLNVPAKSDDIFRAYLEVVASLFGQKAVQYRRSAFPGEGQMSIAAGCQRMIDSVASGVAYSVDPAAPSESNLLIVSAWGQGAAVVEGRAPTDSFLVAKGTSPQIKERRISAKPEGLYLNPEGGMGLQAVPEKDVMRPSLDDAHVIELARLVLRLENYFKRPQDVEWALDKSGKLYVLQSRPLVLRDTISESRVLPEVLSRYELLSEDNGEVAQQGIGSGPVKVVYDLGDLKDFPEGAVLVSRRDSSQFVQIMHKASAIVTEVGTSVSHMSTLCRELGVPCLVNVQGIMGKVHEGMEVTVDAEDRRIYKGRVKELLAYHASTSMNLAATPEFRLIRRILNAVAPLNLVDPLIKKFAPEYCQTYHDILRFVHEMAVREMVGLGRDEGSLLKENIGRRLDLPIPVGILVIDIGGGLYDDAPDNDIPFKYISSIPFRALLSGMLFPGVWHREAMQVSAKDMINSMLTVPTDTLQGQYSGHNIAIVSREYMNVGFRLGYHFNIIDAYCSERDRDNHIYFRFLGGATDVSKRSRRAQLISMILEAFDFNVRTKGDIVTARAGNMPRSEMERTLDILGRLIGFTRQLDVKMESDEVVERFAEAFLSGDYDIVTSA